MEVMGCRGRPTGAGARGDRSQPFEGELGKTIEAFKDKIILLGTTRFKGMLLTRHLLGSWCCPALYATLPGTLVANQDHELWQWLPTWVLQPWPTSWPDSAESGIYWARL